MKPKIILKKTISFVVALFIIIPVIINFDSVNKVSALENYLTVEYNSSHASLSEAYIGKDMDVINLTITGDGILTADDCAFINNYLNVTSLNLANANFENNKIPDDAFSLGGFTSIALPSSLTEIGRNAFRNCGALKNVGMSANLKIIGENAFYNSALESISLPDSIMKIGGGAFEKCPSLISVIALNSDGSKYNAADNAFSGVSSKCVLVTKAGSTGFSGTAFSAIPNKTEWVFYNLPANGMVAAGTDYQMTADVTDIKNNKASYKWYRDGFAINDMTGDTLIIKNISPEYAGRYTVEITLNNTSALFSCIIGVSGTTAGKTTVESKNTAPDHTAKPAEPEKTEYDFVKVIDSNGKELTAAFDITEIKKDQVVQLEFSNQPSEYTYVFYTKKLNDIYNSYKTGTFRLNLNNRGYIDIPFDFINSLKNIDLSGNNQLRINIKKTGDVQYRVYLAITNENGKVLYDFKDVRNLPGVYMYFPHDNKNYIIQIDEAMYAYPVPFVKDETTIIFKIQNNLLYSVQPPKDTDFNDIKNHWGETDIIQSAGNYIVEGFPDGNYKPDASLTRAEFTAMLVRALYYNMTEEQRVFAGPEKPNVYSDVKANDWFKNNIKYADIMGLTDFISGNEFMPNQKITREEMAYMIAKALDFIKIKYPVPAEPSALKYSDKEEINESYGKYVEICTNMKLLQGSGGYFKPKDGLTRAEAATVLNRLLNLTGENV